MEVACVPVTGGDEQHIGFRVGAAVAEALVEASNADGTFPRTSVVREAILRGLALMAADPDPRISAAAASAGQQQFSVRLSRAEVSELEAQQTRIAHSEGRPVVRVFVLRECLLRGLARARAAVPEPRAR